MILFVHIPRLKEPELDDDIKANLELYKQELNNE